MDEIHVVFHVNNLRPNYPDDENYRRDEVTCPLITMKDTNGKEVEEIFTKRTRRINSPEQNVQEFLVKWEGFQLQ